MSGIVSKNGGRGSGTVGAGDVGADAVDGSNISDDAIDSEHYADGSIDNAHIADDAIDSEHYADGSIDNAHIADDAIDSEHYAAGSIDTAHIAINQIDETLMKDAFVGDFTDATVTASDYFLHGDATDSGNTKRDTIQGVLDLVPAGADTSLSNLTSTGEEKISTGWVNFNGTGTVAIRDSLNVSSITDGGTGIYTVNWATSMANANYCVTMGVSLWSSPKMGSYITVIATGSCTLNPSRDSGGGHVDTEMIAISAFGGV